LSEPKENPYANALAARDYIIGIFGFIDDRGVRNDRRRPVG